MAGLGVDARGVIAPCSICGQKNRMAFGRIGETIRCGKCHAPLAPPAATVHVGSDADFEALTRASSLPVLVDFWAPWCAPCRTVAPEMDRVASASQGQLLVAKVNTEDLPAIAGRYGVRSIPTMALFAGGREIGRTSGARPAAAIQAFVTQTLRDTPAASRI